MILSNKSHNNDYINTLYFIRRIISFQLKEYLYYYIAYEPVALSWLMVTFVKIKHRPRMYEEELHIPEVRKVTN
jgi:hypothetical protein